MRTILLMLNFSMLIMQCLYFVELQNVFNVVQIEFSFGNFWGSTFMYTFLRHVWKSAGLGYSQ